MAFLLRRNLKLVWTTLKLLKYICRVYHQLLQYIAKLRRIMIDLYKSHLVTIETPRNHSSSQHRTVFAIVEKYIEIVMNFLISKKGLSFQITLKLHKKHDLNHFCVDAYFIKKRLCPWPPDPNTVGKLRLSSFCIYKNIGGLLWADFELELIQTMSLCVVVVIHYNENAPIKR